MPRPKGKKGRKKGQKKQAAEEEEDDDYEEEAAQHEADGAHEAAEEEREAAAEPDEQERAAGGFRGKVAKLGQGKPPDPEEPACFQCDDSPTRMPTRIKKIKWYQYGSARLKAAAGLRVCSKDWCHEKCYKSLVKVRA